MSAPLRWGIRASLVKYIVGVGGEVSVSDPAAKADDGSFEFAPLSFDGRTLEFDGEVRLSAHGGLLSIVIARPRLEGRDTGPVVLTAEDAHGVRRAIVTLKVPTWPLESGRAATSLAEGAEEMFQFNYPTGSPFDDLSWGIARPSEASRSLTE